MSYCTRSVAPHTIRLMVPGDLPSTRISRGLTTTASAIAGLVMAMRVTSKVVGTIVERPAVTDTCGMAAGCWAIDNRRGRGKNHDEYPKGTGALLHHL